MEIKLDRVTYRYPDQTLAVQDVSLRIQMGERVALLGQNGAGKTTLARQMNGLLQPTRGDVWVGEWNTRVQPVAFLARWVGYAYQNPDDQLFCRTIWDEVAFGPRNFHLPEEEIQRRVEAALALTELEGKEGMNPFDLSWAMRRRIALASILAIEPAFLILDEPTAGQDPAGIDLMARIVQAYVQAGKTVLAITHDMDFCAENFDRLLVMNQGRLALDAATCDALVKPDLLLEAGLVLPQIQRLAGALGMQAAVRNAGDFIEAYRSHGSVKGRV